MQQQFVRLMVTAASILFALDTVETFEVGPVAPVEIPLSAKERMCDSWYTGGGRSGSRSRGSGVA